MKKELDAVKAAHDKLSAAVEDPEGGNDAEHDAAADLLVALNALYPAIALHDKTPRENLIVAMAREEHEKEGAVEIDDTEQVRLSEGDDNGAYIAAWVWVDFAGTALDKEGRRA